MSRAASAATCSISRCTGGGCSCATASPWWAGCCALPPISASSCAHPSPAVRLLQEGGAVRGAVLATPHGEVDVRAKRGVVLAAGGFPHDSERRRTMFPADQEHRTVAAPCATGDGVRLGEIGGRQGGRHARGTRRLVPGIAGAFRGRHDRPLPAYHRARQARHHRRARRRAALLQRGQWLPRLCRGHAARRAGRGRRSRPG